MAARQATLGRLLDSLLSTAASSAASAPPLARFASSAAKAVEDHCRCLAVTRSQLAAQPDGRNALLEASARRLTVASLPAPPAGLLCHQTADGSVVAVPFVRLPAGTETEWYDVSAALQLPGGLDVQREGGWNGGVCGPGPPQLVAQVTARLPHHLCAVVGTASSPVRGAVPLRLTLVDRVLYVWAEVGALDTLMPLDVELRLEPASVWCVRFTVPAWFPVRPPVVDYRPWANAVGYRLEDGGCMYVLQLVHRRVVRVPLTGAWEELPVVRWQLKRGPERHFVWLSPRRVLVAPIPPLCRPPPYLCDLDEDVDDGWLTSEWRYDFDAGIRYLVQLEARRSGCRATLPYTAFGERAPLQAELDEAAKRGVQYLVPPKLVG